MRTLWLLLASLGLAAARYSGNHGDNQNGHSQDDDDDDNTCHCSLARPINDAHERFINSRLHGQNLRLDDLEQQLAAAEERMVAREKGVNKFHHAYEVLQSRVIRREGPQCKEGYFQCGNDNHVCISHLLVCDGSNDCDNGHDEENSVCDIPTPAGTVLESTLYDNDFCTRRKPHRIRLVITHVEQSATFTAYPRIQYSIIIYFRQNGKEQSDILHGDGHYDFSARNLRIYAPENDHLGIDCKFDGVHKHQCRAAIIHDFTHEVCVSFVMRVLEGERDL